MRVRNLAARLRGTGEGRAILLVAHYDSAAAAPGAADDGHAVAVLLETLRALRAGAPLRNDVILLFTDAEEEGLWGARAFVDAHPWRRDVRLVLNFEARGTGGPVWMFRTNPGSGWLVRAFRKAAPYPQASSLGEEVFKFMPNDTDLTEFRRTSSPGMDFAFINPPMYYHSELDRPENLDHRSVYQEGSNTLALAQYLGNLDLSLQPRDEAVYHGTAKTGLLLYSRSLALPFALMAAGLAAVAAVIGVRRRKLTWLGVLAGVGALLVSVASSFAVGWFAEPLLERGLPARFAFGYRYWLYQLAFLGLGVAITSTIYGWLLRRTSVGNLWMGGLAVWAILAVTSSILAAGAGFAFALPLAAAGAAATLWFWWGEARLDRWAPTAAILVLCAPAVFLMAQSIETLMVSFTSSLGSGSPEGGWTELRSRPPRSQGEIHPAGPCCCLAGRCRRGSRPSSDSEVWRARCGYL